MSAPFTFKQFVIQQDKCAMKVGTDGVLLGAWATLKEGNVLDVGCGTGLIALMLAQRIQNAKIDAIDIEENAFLEAQLNVRNSRFKNKINIQQSAFQHFFPSKQYDIIISNPPFFVNSYKPIYNERATARHTNQLTFDELIDNTLRLLKLEGTFALILPCNEAAIFIEKATSKELFLTRRCKVKPNLEKPAKRLLLEFSKQNKNYITEESLVIETDIRHRYTEEYKKLMEAFYL